MFESLKLSTESTSWAVLVKIQPVSVLCSSDAPLNSRHPQIAVTVSKVLKEIQNHPKIVAIVNMLGTQTKVNSTSGLKGCFCFIIERLCILLAASVNHHIVASC